MSTVTSLPRSGKAAPTSADIKRGAAIDSASALIEQARGIADMLTAVDLEALDSATISRTGCALLTLLEQAADRLASAGVPNDTPTVRGNLT